MSTFTETDKILINRGGVDYQTTLAELREYVNYVPPMPWEEHVANGGVVLHVKDATGTVDFDKSDVYEIDGTFKGNINSFNPGEEVVICCDSSLYAFFMGNNSTWNFGELTDVSNANNLGRLFLQCNNFNGTGMSDWNTSNVTHMQQIFYLSPNFNQDLSQWCVSNNVDTWSFDNGATSWEAKHKPVWGTCPRGEDQ